MIELILQYLVYFLNFQESTSSRVLQKNITITIIRMLEACRRVETTEGASVG